MPSGGLLSQCSIRDPEKRQLKLKHTWRHKSGVCFYQASTAGHSRKFLCVVTLAAPTGEMTGVCDTYSPLTYWAVDDNYTRGLTEDNALVMRNLITSGCKVKPNCVQFRVISLAYRVCQL